jgi:O-antigen ligase
LKYSKRKIASSIEPEVTLDSHYQQTPKFATILFFLYIITWFLQLGNRVGFLGAIRFELLLAACMTGFAVFFFKKSKPNAYSSGLLGCIFLYVFVLIIHVIFSYDFERSWIIFVDRVIKFSFMAFFIATYARSPQGIKILMTAFLLACLKMGQEGFVGQLTGSMVWQNQGVMRLHGATPLYAHPNSFSGMALGTLPFLYYFFPLVPRYLKLIFLIMVIFAINIIVFTGSRTGYVGFVFFCLFLFFQSQYKIKLLVAGLIVLFVAIPFVPDQYVQRFNSISGGQEEAEGKSRDRRIEILQDAVTVFVENPLGVGVSAFMAVRQDRFGRNQDTHNLYLEVLTNIGIHGFIIWATLIFVLFRSIRTLYLLFCRQIQQLTDEFDIEAKQLESTALSTAVNEHVNDLSLIRAVLLAVSAYLIIRLVVGMFGMDLYEIYWWFAIGIVIAVQHIATTAKQITAELIAKKQRACK